MVKKKTVKRRKVKMARRRTGVKRYVRRSAGGAKPIIDGAMAGLGANVLGGFIGPWGAPIATLGVGFIRKNNTLKTLGGYELGAQIAGFLPIPGIASTYGNGQGGAY